MDFNEKEELKDSQKDTKEVKKKEKKSKPSQEVKNDLKYGKKQQKEETKKEEKKKLKSEQKNVEEKVEKNSTFKAVEIKKNKKYLSFIFTAILLVILMIFSVIFALININNDKIYSGISIKGVDLSGLTKEEAIESLNELEKQKLSDDIILKLGEFETSINPEQIELNVNIEKAVNEAYNIGRGGNIIINNYQIIGTLFTKQSIKPEVYYNEEVLDKFIGDLDSKIPDALIECSYYIEDDEAIITKGKAGNAIKRQELKDAILTQINEDFITDQLNTNKQESIEIPVEKKEPTIIDINKIYQEIHKEPKDAYYTENPFKVYPHVDGIDFAISIEEVENLLKEEKEEYRIPLKIVKPEFTTDKLGEKAFPDLISTFSTKYDASNINRSTNLELAAGKINNTVLMPGEEFSYNKIVGERTIQAGYKEAAIYEGGKVVDGLGGGICQISSTLYNTALYANLEITERQNHQFITSYVTAGRDATVVYGAIDLKFKNTRAYPIKITCNVNNGVARIDMYGIKENPEYEVVIQTKVTSTIPYTTKYEEDRTKEEGTEVIKQKGTQGYKSETYKILKLNGVVTSKTLLSKDSYNAMQRIIVKGTKSEKKIQTSTQETGNESEENKSTNTIEE